MLKELSLLNIYTASVYCVAACASVLTLLSKSTEATEPSRTQLPPAASKHIDFAADIQPIFAAHCYDCHGADAQESGLRLDVRRKALDGADNGPVIVPNDSSHSRLIQVIAGLDEDTGRMPPPDVADPLTDDQLALLRAWIDQGANWPDALAGEDAPITGADLWSLQPIKRPPPPKIARRDWDRNPIDAFIFAKLEQERIAPAAEADRITLLRRVFLDLIGLPPTLEEARAFLQDDRPDAYERVVDRLLDSPHFGERWGRHWLDLARYADSDGYEKDLGRPFAWRYRDWVISAINNDLPFDEFTEQQLAGDLLPSSTSQPNTSAEIGTGFYRNTLVNREGGIDPEEDRVKRTIDRTNTLGAVWLGLTIGCANCHTHKYDPISQREYFSLYAFFNSLNEVDLPVSHTSSVAATPDFSPQEFVSARRSSAEEVRNPSLAPTAPAAHAVGPAQELFQAIAELEPRRETYVHLRGDFLAQGPMVTPNVLEVLPQIKVRGEQADRLDLARWLTSQDHPLTARVVVNRLWQTYFGRGLVSTADDFGTQGELPSHPELLDWLASELRSGGWRMKRMHRLIVTSAAYRQSSVIRLELAERDPYNRWLARQNRLRVEAEIVRDTALKVSGLLTPAIGGPSIHPPQPSGVSDVTFDNSANWVESTGPNRYRRGLYIWFQRTSPYPSLIGFDAPEANLSCTRRERSNTPLQALTMLNDTAFVECAQALGQRMMQVSPDPGDTASKARLKRLQHGFESALSRSPSPQELAALCELYDEALNLYATDSAMARTLIGSTSASGSLANSLAEVELADASACVIVARAILNFDELITRE